MEQPASPIRQTDDEARLLAKSLIRTARYDTLATLDPNAGDPFASRVGVGTDADGAPTFLISSLAEHTSALMADPRCSLLLGEPGKGDPLAHARISLVGRARRIDGAAERLRVRRRYLKRHPKAQLHVDFKDFSFRRLEIARASFNGGFGKAYLLQRQDLLIDETLSAAMSESEAHAIDHMNEDHAEAVMLYAMALAGAPADSGPWRIIGLDAEGADLESSTDIRRLWFEISLQSPDEWRPALIALLQAARSKIELASPSPFPRPL